MRNQTARLLRSFAAAGYLWTCLNPNPAMTAEPTTEEIKTQIRELDQKLRVLERRLELAKEVATEKAKTPASVSAGADGFMIRSADTNFVLKIRGYVQADGRFYANDHSGGTTNDTFGLRRVRPILEGTMFEKYDFRVMLDFASGTTSTPGNNGFVQEAFVNARFHPGFQVQAGKFKEPVGLERLQSGRNLLFVERGYPTQLVPNRDVGVQVQGDLLGSSVSYAAGVFNGVADGGSGDLETSDDEKDFAGRLFAQPFKNTRGGFLQGLGLGLGGTYGNQEGPLRSYVSPGQQRFFAYRTGAGSNVVADGAHWRLSPQGYFYWGSWGLFGEYVISEQQVRSEAAPSTLATLRHTAWQVAGSYILTGEENSFKALDPRSPFNPANGGWGAWELTARVGELTLDPQTFPLYASLAASARQVSSWGVGLNWHLNKSVKLNLNYDHTHFQGGDAPLFKQGEQVFLTRVQVAF